MLVMRALLLLATLVDSAAASKCYALALSGGGDRGAFEAGAIQGLAALLPPEEVQWNVVTGISAGSILASAAALFDVGEEVAMSQFMVDSIVNFTKADVFKNWFPLGIIQGALWETGLVNADPLYETLKMILSSRPMGNRNFTIGATDDITGRITLFNESMVKDDPTAWPSFIRASSAIPGLFGTVHIEDKVFSDGGWSLGVDVFSAVTRCRQVVESDEDIVLDIITCDKKDLKLWEPSSDDHSLDIFMRATVEKNYDSQMGDILDACLAYPNVNFRYYIEPPGPLPSNGVNFIKSQMEEMVKIGNATAAAAQVGQACTVAQEHRHSRNWPPPDWKPRKKPTQTVMV